MKGALKFLSLVVVFVATNAIMAVVTALLAALLMNLGVFGEALFRLVTEHVAVNFIFSMMVQLVPYGICGWIENKLNANPKHFLIVCVAAGFLSIAGVVIGFINGLPLSNADIIAIGIPCYVVFTYYRDEFYKTKPRKPTEEELS